MLNGSSTEHYLSHTRFSKCASSNSTHQFSALKKTVQVLARYPTNAIAI